MERVEQFFLASNIDDAHKVQTLIVELDRWEDLRSAEGSSCTEEASYKIFSTDSFHSTGAFEPEALGNCGKDFFSTRETSMMKGKAFCLTWLS